MSGSDSTGAYTIVSRMYYSGGELEEHKEELYDFMADRVNRFVDVFRPRLGKIADQQDSD